MVILVTRKLCKLQIKLKSESFEIIERKLKDALYYLIDIKTNLGSHDLKKTNFQKLVL